MRDRIKGKTRVCRERRLLMYLAARSHIIYNRSLIEMMHLFRSMGFQGMELSLQHGNGNWLDVNYLDDYVIDKVNETSAQIGLEIAALACHQNYVDDYTYEVEKKLLKCANKYHTATNVVILSTFLPFEERELHTKECYEKLYIRTKELCKIAEDQGVVIAIEVEPNQLIHNLNTFFDLVEKVNSPALKLNFDVGHIYLSEVDIFKAMERAKDYIVYSHLDNMCMGEHCHKLPWEGEIDLEAVYQKMKAEIYDGPVSLDIYLQNYEEVAPQCLAYVNQHIFHIK